MQKTQVEVEKTPAQTIGFSRQSWLCVILKGMSLETQKVDPKDRKILVIDDDPDSLSIIAEALRWDGYQTQSAISGAEGLALIQSWSPDLILLDVNMPGMNGLDVLTRLKIHEHTQKIPVLMLTGESKAEDIMAGYNIGADYYITKPFTRQQLLFGLNLLLEKESQG